MKKNKPGCAVPGGPTASDEFRKDLFLVRPLESAEKGNALQLALEAGQFHSGRVYRDGQREDGQRHPIRADGLARLQLDGPGGQ